MRDSAIIYRSFYEAIKELPDSEQSKVWNAVFELSLNFKEVALEGMGKTIFNLIKPQIQANIKKYELGNKYGYLGAEHGKKGGRGNKKNPHKTLIKPSNENEKEKEEIHTAISGGVPPNSDGVSSSPHPSETVKVVAKNLTEAEVIDLIKTPVPKRTVEQRHLLYECSHMEKFYHLF